MSSNAETAVSAGRPAAKQIIVDFSPIALRAPFFLRCGALLLDYLLMISIPVIALIFGRLMGEDGARLLSSEVNNGGWLIALLVCFCNVVLLPMVAGQSLGKMIAGLRIVKINGEDASARAIVFRQTFGYLLTLSTLGIGFVLSVFSSKGRALHDYVAGTVVVYANSRNRP